MNTDQAPQAPQAPPITTGIKYFTAAELRCKGSGVIKLDPRFAEALIKLREKFADTMIPTSVCRTPAHNTAVGGHPRSLHLTENPAHPGANGTMAADIRWAEWPQNRKIMFCRTAWRLGWSIGLNNAFVHIDRRKDLKIPKAVFKYSGAWDGGFGKAEIIKAAVTPS